MTSLQVTIAALAAFNILTGAGQGIYFNAHKAGLPGGKKFKHWPWSIAYGLLCAGLWMWSKPFWIWYGLYTMASRLVFFNTVENVVRRLPILYFNDTDTLGSPEHFLNQTQYKYIYFACLGGTILYISIFVI